MDIHKDLQKKNHVWIEESTINVCLKYLTWQILLCITLAPSFKLNEAQYSTCAIKK